MPDSWIRRAVSAVAVADATSGPRSEDYTTRSHPGGFAPNPDRLRPHEALHAASIHCYHFGLRIGMVCTPISICMRRGMEAGCKTLSCHAMSCALAARCDRASVVDARRTLQTLTGLLVLPQCPLMSWTVDAWHAAAASARGAHFHLVLFDYHMLLPSHGAEARLPSPIIGNDNQNLRLRPDTVSLSPADNPDPCRAPHLNLGAESGL